GADGRLPGPSAGRLLGARPLPRGGDPARRVAVRSGGPAQRLLHRHGLPGAEPLHRPGRPGERALPRHGPAGRPLRDGGQGDQAPPPADGLRHAGVRGRGDGLPRRRLRHADEAAGGVSVRGPKRLPPEQLAPYLLEVFPPPGPPAAAPPPPADPLDWGRGFGNDRPVELEVGFGKGLFLLTAARARPGVNFLGCEIVRKYVLFTATRLAKRGVPNVKLVCGDAQRLLAERVPPKSLQTVHV